ncbi:Thiamine pyrophosphokinase [Spathaspora sp. JA1]|nr:Thiamine pyrophosphokinase [Spathaspora sp. JA1]
MSKEAQLKEEVTESPDTITIEPPSNPTYTIYPFAYLSPSIDDPTDSALLILNQTIQSGLESLWQSTTIHVCADGATNQLYRHFLTNETREKFIPDYIVGDFDSLDPEIGQYYQARGTRLIKQESQYSTDFTKAIRTIQLHFKLGSIPQVDSVDGLSVLWEALEKPGNNILPIKIYTIGGIGGRFDQTIHSISQLYILHSSYPNLEIFFITKYDTIFLLPKGINHVRYENRQIFNTRDKIPPCGLLPLSNKSIVLTTHGLKYDVTNWNSDMLGKVSSSNCISGSDGFIVEASDAIVMNISTGSKD